MGILLSHFLLTRRNSLFRTSFTATSFAVPRWERRRMVFASVPHRSFSQQRCAFLFSSWACHDHDNTVIHKHDLFLFKCHENLQSWMCVMQKTYVNDNPPYYTSLSRQVTCVYRAQGFQGLMNMLVHLQGMRTLCECKRWRQASHLMHSQILNKFVYWQVDVRRMAIYPGPHGKGLSSRADYCALEQYWLLRVCLS